MKVKVYNLEHRGQRSELSDDVFGVEVKCTCFTK